MNQNEQQPERTAMQELIKFIDSDAVLMVCGNAHRVRMKAAELFDTVEKEQRQFDYENGQMSAEFNPHVIGNISFTETPEGYAMIMHEKHPNHGK